MSTQQDDPLPDSEAEIKLGRRQRIRHDWNNLIEDLVSDGQDNGVFDDLSGKGKPLKLGGNNVYEAGKELAHQLLRDNDMQPVWISDRKQILTGRDALRADIAKSWQRHKDAFKMADGKDARGRLTISWDDACLNWQKEIGKLNQQIKTFNLKRPVNHLEIVLLQLEDELRRAGAPRWLLTIND